MNVLIEYTHNIFKFIMNPTELGIIPDKVLFLKSLYKLKQ